jgi:hypothetical protein
MRWQRAQQCHCGGKAEVSRWRLWQWQCEGVVGAQHIGKWHRCGSAHSWWQRCGSAVTVVVAVRVAYECCHRCVKVVSWCCLTAAGQRTGSPITWTTRCALVGKFWRVRVDSVASTNNSSTNDEEFSPCRNGSFVAVARRADMQLWLLWQ